jgi:hypothetical protein
MTIHDMMQQVALLSSGVYHRDKSVSRIEIRTPGNRMQVLYGHVQRIGGENVGVLYTKVGTLADDIDPVDLLSMNVSLRHTRVAVLERHDIILIAMFDLVRTSINECAPMLQELAAVADNLEQQWFKLDLS